MNTPIGEIGNTYGGLLVKTEDGVYYWGIEDPIDSIDWEEIPKALFDELNKFNQTK